MWAWIYWIELSHFCAWFSWYISKACRHFSCERHFFVYLITSKLVLSVNHFPSTLVHLLPLFLSYLWFLHNYYFTLYPKSNFIKINKWWTRMLCFINLHWLTWGLWLALGSYPHLPFFLLLRKPRQSLSQLLFKLEVASLSTSGQWDINKFLLGSFLFLGKKKHIPDSCCCYCHFLLLPFVNRDSMSDLQQLPYHHEVTRRVIMGKVPVHEPGYLMTSLYN